MEVKLKPIALKAIENREKEVQKESPVVRSREKNQESGKKIIEQHTLLKEEDARRDVEYYSGQYRDITISFANEKNKKRIDYDNYVIWEEEAKEAFLKMTEMEYEANFKDTYEKDTFERIAVREGKDSVEAYAGNFFNRRKNLLLEAIRNNENKETMKRDLDTVESLLMFVAGHINAITNYELSRTNQEEYQRKRQAAHNAMIERLNQISELAEEYGTERLIFRNLKTNDFIYDEHKDYSGQTNGRAEYDRSAAEEYVRLAFSRDFEQIEAEEKRGRNSNSLVSMFHTKE